MQTITLMPAAATPSARISWAVMLTVCMVTAPCAIAGAAGEISFSRGAGLAQSPGENPRMLGAGLALNEGDKLTTSDAGSAIVRMLDGTRLTLRAKTELVIEKFSYKAGAADNRMLVKLTQGGVRVVSGEISKTSPEKAQISTVNGVLTMQGANFDARLCGPECQRESSKTGRTPSAAGVSSNAKFVEVKGSVAAISDSGERRQIFVGAAVNKGDSVEAGPGASGVLVFQDDSRLTVSSDTLMKIDDYRFDAQKPESGSSVVSLVKGSMRALTGVIGKENNAAVSYNTPTATIGIRGTGLDMDCSVVGACSYFTWQGMIAIVNKTQTGQPPILLPVGSGLRITPTSVQAAPPTLQNLRRPDQVPVKVDQLFTISTGPGEQIGLVVTVREGTVALNKDDSTLYLSSGEVGVAAPDGQVIRPATRPLFTEVDKTPLPGAVNPLLQSLFNEVNVRTVPGCP